MEMINKRTILGNNTKTILLRGKKHVVRYIDSKKTSYTLMNYS